MADYQMLGELLGLPNVNVLGYQLTGHERIEVQLRSNLAAALCPECQQISPQVHDTVEAQTLRDLPMWGPPVLVALCAAALCVCGLRSHICRTHAVAHAGRELHGALSAAHLCPHAPN